MVAGAAQRMQQRRLAASQPSGLATRTTSSQELLTALLLSFYAYRLVHKMMPSASEASIKVLARHCVMHCVTCQGMTDGFETRGKEEWRPL